MTTSQPARQNPAAQQAQDRNASELRVSMILLTVLLPFVTGYFLSYYFRTVNAVLSGRLSAELDLDAAQLGLMTASYFLMAAMVQLPFGALLDRMGPKRLQATCLLVAATGALLFSIADDFGTLFAARAMIGIGVASALMSGLKALAMCCTPGQVGLLNGVFMCIGASGAIAASVPTEELMELFGWRQLFAGLAVVTLAAAAVIAIVAPSVRSPMPVGAAGAAAPGYREILTDRRFWRLAPLSAWAIGGAWALQGLWASPWLRDVAGLDQGQIATTLLVMAISLSAGALSFGVILHRLNKWGVPSSFAMAAAALAFVGAEVSLGFGLDVPAIIPWCMIAVFGAGTVLSYTMSAQLFPKESIGRANSALNLFHFGAAFAVQSLFGRILALWPRDELGHYPPEAYQAAFLLLAVLQLVSLIWFLRPVAAKPSREPAGNSLPEPPRPRAPAAMWRPIFRLGALVLLIGVLHQSLPPGLRLSPASLPDILASAGLGSEDREEKPDSDRIEHLARLSASQFAVLSATQERIAAMERQLDALHLSAARAGAAATVELAESRQPRHETGVPVQAVDLREHERQLGRILEGVEVGNSRLTLVAHRIRRLEERVGAIDRQARALTSRVVETERSARPPDREAASGAQVHVQHCAELARATERRRTLYFARGQRDLTDEQRRSLRDFGRRASACSDEAVIVSGFTDDRGSAELNRSLSRERAALVGKVLAESGIRSGLIQVFGLGPANPIADNDTEEGRDRNRRVEVRLRK